MPIRAVAQSEATIETIKLGMESQTRLGKWTPVLIETKNVSQHQPVSYVVSTLDSSATTIDYTGTLTPLGDNQYQALAKLGRQHGSISVALLDADGEEICRRRVAAANTAAIQVSTSNQLLLIGGHERLKNSSESAMSALLGDSPHSVIATSSATNLPVNWMGYDAINTILLAPHNRQQLKDMTAEQWQAIDSWINRGGRLIVSTSGSQGELGPQGILARFLVGEFNETVQLESVARLDSYSKIRLEVDELAVADLDVKEGSIELGNESTPLIVRQIRGLGQIVFVTFDITDPAMEQWKGLTPTVTRLLKSGELDEITASKDFKRPAGVGFTDIAGQLRIPLEQFSKVHLVNFTVVAVLIGLYILCVGPGDFFMLKKFAKKMELTWISFTLFTLAFCGIAYLLGNWSRPQEMQINQLEIVDIDQATGIVRGNTWSNIFSPKTGQHSVNFEVNDSVGIDVKDSLISWLGTPGDGIGGMQSKAGLSVSQSQYSSTLTEDNEHFDATIDQLPLQVSSTRSLHTEWSGQFNSPIVSKLKFENSTLTGQIVNPFPFELKNVRVIYGNYARVLVNTLPPESTFDLSGETREWTVKGHLTRRTKSVDKKDRGQNLPWDPTSARMDRIADMMMFYAVAGGRDYTSLTHDFQNRIDMSEYINYDRAIFVGEVELNTGQITIDGKSPEESYDKQLTVFRILLPVE